MKENVIRFCKVTFLLLFYRLEWTDKNPWGRQKFVFHPRVWAIRIGALLLWPFLWVIAGFQMLVAVFTDKYKVQDWTSYTIDKGERQDRKTAYSKF